MPPALPIDVIAHILSLLPPPQRPSLYPALDAVSLQDDSASYAGPSPSLQGSSGSGGYLRDLCSACLVSRDIAPYARRLLYSSVTINSARQARLLARTLNGHDGEDGTEATGNQDDSFTGRPYGAGTLVHPEMLRALGPAAAPETQPSSNADAQAEDDSTSAAYDVSAQAGYLSSLIRHVCILHYDASLASSDKLSDTYTWAPSLRTLFSKAEGLRTLSFFARPNGAAMEQLFHPKTTARLRRMTVQCLG